MLDKLVILIEAIKDTIDVESFYYRDFLGLILKLQIINPDLAPIHKIMVSESGPWSFQCAFDIKSLEKRGVILLSDDFFGENKEIRLKKINVNEKLKDVSKNLDNDYLSKLKKIIECLTKEDFKFNVPCRWAKHWCYQEREEIEKDILLNKFDMLGKSLQSCNG